MKRGSRGFSISAWRLFAMPGTRARPSPGPSAGRPNTCRPSRPPVKTSLVGPRSDVFALGGVLYFLLVGRAPFHGKDVLDSLAKARACDFDSAASARGTSRRAGPDMPPRNAGRSAGPLPDRGGHGRRPGSLPRAAKRIRRAILAAGVGGLLLAVAALVRMALSFAAARRPGPLRVRMPARSWDGPCRRSSQSVSNCSDRTAIRRRRSNSWMASGSYAA